MPPCAASSSSTSTAVRGAGRSRRSPVSQGPAPAPKRDSAQASVSTAVAEASRTPSRCASSGDIDGLICPPLAGGSTAKTWARRLAPCATRAPKRVAGETSAKPEGRGGDGARGGGGQLAATLARTPGPEGRGDNNRRKHGIEA